MVRFKGLKILEVCPFSAGACGVWSRVFEESKALKKAGYQVRIFSTNAVKGSKKQKAFSEEKISAIRISRFPYIKLGGESFMLWDYEGEALDYSPDIIIAHVYRHLHTTKALKIIRKLRSLGRKPKVFLVTHAPFVEGDETRGFLGKAAVRFYDKIIGPSTINNFDKVVSITKWELPYLRKLKLKNERIAYVPNGVSEDFFKQKAVREENKIVFLGRISPVKNIELLISAAEKINDKKIIFEIVGPAEEDYLKRLKSLVAQKNLGGRFLFSEPVYDIKEKIKKIDSAKIFILPSNREAMPVSLIEALSRGRMIISSETQGGREIITDGFNGLLFKKGDLNGLIKKINHAIDKNNASVIRKIKNHAKNSGKRFSWDSLVNELTRFF